MTKCILLFLVIVSLLNAQRLLPCGKDDVKEGFAKCSIKCGDFSPVFCSTEFFFMLPATKAVEKCTQKGGPTCTCAEVKALLRTPALISQKRDEFYLGQNIPELCKLLCIKANPQTFVPRIIKDVIKQPGKPIINLTVKPKTDAPVPPYEKCKTTTVCQKQATKCSKRKCIRKKQCHYKTHKKPVTKCIRYVEKEECTKYKFKTKCLLRKLCIRNILVKGSWETRKRTMCIKEKRMPVMHYEEQCQKFEERKECALKEKCVIKNDGKVVHESQEKCLHWRVRVNKDKCLKWKSVEVPLCIKREKVKKCGKKRVVYKKVKLCHPYTKMQCKCTDYTKKCLKAFQVIRC